MNSNPPSARAYVSPDARDISETPGQTHRLRPFVDRAARAACLAAASLLAPPAFGNSQGSPICEVNSLPLVEMSPTLANPAPQGWTLESPSRFFAGQPVQLRLRHPDSQRRARGVLIWAKAGPTAGAGSFSVPENGRWDYIPLPTDCGTWALSHTDSLPKSLNELVFEWTGDSGPSAILRAFIIEDCSSPSGCRDQQALTPIVFIEAGLFADGFEEAIGASERTDR